MTDISTLVTRGLSEAEAERRLAEHGPNQLPSAKPRNLLQQAAGVLREPMLLFLLAAGGINFALAEPLDGVILMFTVLIVIGISIVQEHRTETALVALRDLSAPRALVIRDGAQVRIPGYEVVPGDVVLLVEGDRVPADALVLQASSLSVDESALTGESVPVRKETSDDPDADLGEPGGDATPWVFSGTLVVKGRGVAVVRATGLGSQLGVIGSSLSEISPERTPLQREIDRIVRVIAVLGLGAAIAVFTIYGITRGNWLEGALAGIATAMAMLPEEFPVVLTVFLALGAWKMSRKNVLTRRSPVIETLGSATVLCVDKTGTLTQNSMVVREFVLDGTGHRFDEGPLPDGFRHLAETSVLASPVDPFDPMDRAFRTMGDEHLADSDHLAGDPELLREYPLSEDLLALSHVWRTRVDGPLVVAAKGAPEAIARLCGLDSGSLATLTQQVERATASGQRVLAVARADHDPDAPLPDDQTAFAFRFLGLAGLHDPVRPGVPEAVAECRRAGIRVVMITGDYPGTAMAIAREIGLEHAGGVVTGPELREMSDEDLARRISEVSVFARVVPQQKLRIVRALQRNGDVVGMTGDGVNDAPALRAADIGIAVGRRGTDVAREAASLVITDDDFTSIVQGIRLGRGIFDNLRKAMSYLIAVHVAIFGMALLPVFVADWPLVLLPIQIAFLEFIIDPTCTIVFESEEIDPEVMDRPPRGLGGPLFGRTGLLVAFLQGVGALAAVLGVYLWGLSGERPDPEVRSLAFSTLVLTNVLLLLVNRSWRISVLATFRERRNPALRYILAAALGILGVVLTVAPVRGAFDLSPVPLLDLGVAALAGFAGVVWFEVYKAVRRRAGSEPGSGAT